MWPENSIRTGLMPSDKAERKKLETLDPWILRARAINEVLQPYEIGRLLFHLSKCRGFKSNRKTDKADNHSGKVYDGIKRTRALLQGSVADGIAMVPDGDNPALAVEHPTGELVVLAQRDADGAMSRTEVLRTARKLFDGRVYPGPAE